MNNFDDIISTSTQKRQVDTEYSKDDYAAKKKAERDGVFELSDKTAIEVSTDSSTFQKFLDVQSKFNRYSAVNALLILAQKPDAKRIGNFDYWKDKGGFIKSGQSSFSIFEPHEYTKDDGTPGVGYNIKKMFDVSQIDTRKIRANTQQREPNDRTLLTALVSKASGTITGVDKIPQIVPHDMQNQYGGATNPETDEIYILKGKDFTEMFTALAIELSYNEILYRTDDTTNARFNAHCSAYMLCKKYGISTDSFDFSNAPEMFRLIPDVDPQAIKYELSVMRDAMDSISGRMERHLDSVLQKPIKSQEAR